MRIGLISFLILCLSVQLQAQDLYIPRNIKNAYTKGTRSKDGRPGKNYWQNYARYDIAVAVNPPDRRVTGKETIIYVNNSPDTMSFLLIRLYLNSHTAGAVRQYPVGADYMTSGIQIDKYKLNDIEKTWRVSDPVNTFKEIRLDKKLNPKDSVKLSFDWHYDLSIQSNREGVLDSTSFYLAYFYPRVGVYDDYYGWDRTFFSEAQEFYNDFSDYSFQVKVPANYIVWATGELQNASDVLQNKYEQRLTQSYTSDSVIHIASAEELKSRSVTVQMPYNIWKWKAKYVPDIALCISDHYIWDAGSVVVDSKTKRRASVQSAYEKSAIDFPHMVDFGKHALSWFSNNLPGVPYPYPKMTIVQGFADMEYPMMVNDNTESDLELSRFVAEHEIAHSYFPFYMGINEARYGYMDEGWTTSFEYHIGLADLGKEKCDKSFTGFRVIPWIKDNAADEDLPIITPSHVLSGVALGNNEYGKPALAYLALYDLLGDALFKKSLHEFMNRWHGKHPMPWDMFYCFNDASGRNLNWFFNSWFFSNGYTDLAIGKVEASGSQYKVLVENIGGFLNPFDIQLHYTDGTSERIHQTPQVWQDNPKQTLVKVNAKSKVKSISIDNGIYMDANEADNSWKAAN